MAMRQVTTNEIVEMVYQWYQGGSIKSIERSLGFDRKTIRKYVKWDQNAGFQRGESFPEETDLICRIKTT